MGNESTIGNTQKWRYSIYTGIVLVLLFNPLAFNLTHQILGFVQTKSGIPTLIGYILHLCVFVAILRVMMDWNI
jgi:hypothetical protein